jgi:hypothetical protein
MKNGFVKTGLKMIGRISITITGLALLLLAITPNSVRAQGEASIGGTVTDSTGAIIPKVTVSVKDLETGAVRTVATDASGRYEAPLLGVGRYEVSTEKTGFKTVVKTGITLVVGQRSTVDFTLQVGEIQQSVQVEETALQLDVTNAENSGLVGETQVKELPLNGRSYDQLLTLNPGVVNYTSQRAGGIGTSNSVVGNMFSASGHRPQENLYLLNGVEFTGASEVNNTPGGTSGQLLGVDAVREFAIVKDTYGAEYGKRPGAQVNIVTSSGSNAVRGNAYEFLRNSDLDARNFFDLPQIPEFQRNDFGGSLGGPLKKDKTFLFANYEGFRQNLGLSDVTLVPDANARNGIINGVSVPLGSGCSAAQQAACKTAITSLLNLWPLANGPELLTPAGAQSGIAEAFSDPQQRIREDFGTARVDQTIRANDSLAGVYTADDSSSNSPTTNPFTRVDVYLREQVVSASETHVFSPSILNKATVGFSRGGFFFDSGTTVAGLSSWVNPNLPIGALVIGGGTTLNGASQLTNGGTNAGSNLTAVRNLYTAEDQVTINHGIHLLNFGVWFERLQSNDSLVQDQYGQASFTNLTSFLQGSVSTYTFAPGATPLSWRSLEGAFYFEDAIKLRPSLEIRLGFRDEFTTGWSEAYGRASNYAFDSSTNVILAQPVTGFPTITGNSPLTTNNAKFLPAPRVGIAWSPFGSKKTVISAGGGLYYALVDNLSYRLDQNGPTNPVYAAKSIKIVALPTTTASSAGVFVIPSGVQPNLQTPTVESYTLKIEQQITPSTTLSVGYSGSHGYHELLSIDANVPAGGPPYPTQVTTATSTGLANPSVWNTTHWFSEGISSYNGLEVDANHQLSHGLQIRGVYTYSKSLNDGDSMNTSVATNSPAFASNPLDPMADYGRASFDIRNSGVISATYSLPFGRGTASAENSVAKTLLGDWQISGIETILSGLPFTPQLSYNPSNDGDTRNPVRPSLNPAFTGSIIEGSPTQYFNPNAFITPTAGTYGNVGRNTLEGPGIVETDLSFSKKFLFTERFNLQFRAELFNIFNHTNFNTPNPVVYSAAGAAGLSPTAGVITSTSTSSRQVQFGLKLLF